MSVDVGKQPVERLAVGEEIAVVVDVHRHAEPVFEHRAERDPASKRGQVAEIADHAGRVVRGTRKREGDGRRPARLLPHAGKAFDDLRQARVEIVAAGRQRQASRGLAIARDGRETEARPSGVERQDDAPVVLPGAGGGHAGALLAPASEKRERRQVREAGQRNEESEPHSPAIGREAHERRQRRAAEDRHAHQPGQCPAALGAALDRQRENERPDVREPEATEDDPGQRRGSVAGEEKPETRQPQQRAQTEETPRVEEVQDERAEEPPRRERDEEEAGPEPRGRGGEIHAEAPRQERREP